jgi:tellurite resistance-related uncharacterized protein
MSEPSSNLPDDVVLVRTTPVFDNDTVPAALLRAHRVSDDVWGRLVVHTGTLCFTFDDDPGEMIMLADGGSTAIPPGRQHHLELHGPTTFVIEFWKTKSARRQASRNDDE